MQGRKVMMNNVFKSGPGNWYGHLPPPLQLLVAMTLVFLLAFGADALLQRVVELFLAGIAEQDAFFYSAVRQQDAFAQNILALIKLVSFLRQGSNQCDSLNGLGNLIKSRSRSEGHIRINFHLLEL